MGVLVGPLQESHLPFDRLVGVLERALLGQFLPEHPCQLPYPLVAAECAPVDEDDYVLRGVALQVHLEHAFEATLAPPIFGQVQVVIEHLSGRASTRVAHNDPPSSRALRSRRCCHPTKPPANVQFMDLGCKERLRVLRTWCSRRLALAV